MDASRRKPFVKKEAKPVEVVSETMRLNKYIANAGVCSRRDADKLIEKGEITVNGKVVTQLGTSVGRKDDIRYQGQRLNPEEKVYVLLNKPKGYVTTVEDKHAKQTVMDLVEDACEQRIYPVGRLDKQTTGLLLLTNDGELTKMLTHPKYNAKKIYHVFTDKPVFASHLEQLASGITLEDGPIHADAISYAEKDDKTQVGIEIHSGRNRIVRRMFEHLGYKVMKLDRVYFAGLTKKGVPRGKWRYLTDKEVTRLKAGMLK
ncbi:rRNA pseudouridine synthase [Carboxylicivirga mesophila]|uniref:Pseudouridine synthase n=2 Tax=Carboxylicivirga mesophila TaxID=1166478 RepID=A0ABS5K877_9BACT|nr:rRNA pseudouridine synthase [Carboxylicivirga mesophila]